MKKSWYSIQARADQPAEVSVHAEIGMWGIDAATFLRDLKQIQSSTINLSINSPGGSVFDALAMLNGLRASGKEIRVSVLGIAASAASVLAMAGDHVSMPENTMMMVHKPLLGLRGNADDLRSAADILDKVQDGIGKVYMSRWKGTEEELAQALTDETYFTAAECLEHGLCDEVTASVPVEASFEVDALPEAIRAVFNAVKPAEPEPEPAAAAPSLTASVLALATREGLAEYAALFAADPGVADEPTALAAMAVAKETRELCALAGMPEAADGLIRSRSALPQVRAFVAGKLAEASPHIPTARTSEAENKSSGPAAFDPHAIRREMQLQRSK
jgi:ATP-dependent protease ClpP protease subunit